MLWIDSVRSLAYHTAKTTATDAARKWAPVFAETNGWGAMHIVIEDWNLDDGDLEFCRTYEGVTPREVELIDAIYRAVGGHLAARHTR